MLIKMTALLACCMILLGSSAFSIQETRGVSDRSIEVYGKIDTLDFSHSFPNLDNITFYYPKAWKNDLNPFAGKKDDMGLSHNENLRSMSVQVGPYGGILALTYLPNLESLDIYNIDYRPIDDNFFEHFPNLKSLSFRYGNFPSLENIAQLPYFGEFVF